jgi:superfamily II DNA/RNA helicase
LTDPSTATAEPTDHAPHDAFQSGEPVTASETPIEAATPEPMAPEPVDSVEVLEESVPVEAEAAEPTDESLTAQEEADAWGSDDDEEPQPELADEPPRPLFSDLGLSEAVLQAIADMGYRHPTPIQEQAIPYVLMGRDVMGTAQTGTGKTAGFTLPMLDILSGSRARARMPRSLILEPTRELALQVAENFVMYGKYLKLTHALIIGGESMSDQKEALNKGVDVLIATPGRLIDMFERGTILLTDAKLLVIDEADRMLDMGFIPDVERIVAMLPKTRQTLFFSATMGPEIKRLADAFLQNPKEIAVSRPASVATTITEGLALVAEHDKREALRHLIRTENVQNALIFCNRKVDVDILFKSLRSHKFDVGALHGDMAQTVRFATLEKFKANELRLLVCSDVAARGLDIGGLSHVFNFDVPHHAEDYVHRIGRTGRAGLEGRAFTIAAPTDRFAVEAIEKLTGHAIPPVTVEGLDPVDWAEDDGRKRRGRGGPKKGAAAAPRKSAARDKAPRDDKPMREDKPLREGRPPRERTPRPPREIVPEVVEVRAEAVPAERARPDRYRDQPRDQPRDFRRERGRRDDDLGPAVLGFGDDVPAFMLLRTRAPQHIQETESDT